MVHNEPMSSPHGLDPDSAPTLEVLGPDECFALLASRRFGRLAVVSDGHPEIFPVNYLLNEKTIVLRTQEGVKLTNASLSRVAF